jgi:hypothetical protein
MPLRAALMTLCSKGVGEGSMLGGGGKLVFVTGESGMEWEGGGLGCGMIEAGAVMLDEARRPVVTGIVFAVHRLTSLSTKGSMFSVLVLTM